MVRLFSKREPDKIREVSSAVPPEPPIYDKQEPKIADKVVDKIREPTTVIEREITLSLLNDKLNAILNILQELYEEDK